MIEEWRDIRGYEGLYQVSNTGHIRSLDRVVKNRYSTRTIKGRVLKPAIGNSGYYYVNLCVNRYGHCVDVHRIEALEFYGYHNSHLTVNHEDGNKLNNALSNLKFLSQAENNKHKMEVLGKIHRPDVKGKRNPMFGKKHSDITKQKIREAALNRSYAKCV